jgi:DNA-binding HxlR family transcriptional regulator
MPSGYNQFCPVAKGAEIIATRWTPLILRELMAGERSFNDIHRGMPSMSRALLAERLQQLEADDIVAKRPRHDGKGSDYCLTPAGEALRGVVTMIGQWGLIYGRQRVRPGDCDDRVLLWGLRRRVDRDAIPDRRTVVRFELSGVSRCRSAASLSWLVLERSGVDVCIKNPGYQVDAVISGPIAALIAVYLGHLSWREATKTRLSVDGNARQIGKWLRLDQVVGRDFPILPERGEAE